jgi:hypothetical protein
MRIENTVYGGVYMSGITGSGTASSSIQGQMGFGAVGTDPSTWTQWIDAAFVEPPLPTTYDEYSVNFSAPALGSYDYAYRFRYNGGPWTYGDADSSANGYNYDQAGRMTVN